MSAKNNMPASVDAVIIGGGFYGACIALYLRRTLDNVMLVEAEDCLLGRASFVNQARIHTGFHYPRSFVTAQRSLSLYKRFVSDFREAVVDDFTMLYAIARNGSKISPRRFERMFCELGAPISVATDFERAMFDGERIAAVFRCEEYAFDAVRLRELLCKRLESEGIDLRTGLRVTGLIPERDATSVIFETGETLHAPIVVNATYGNAAFGGIDPTFTGKLKYELAEVALITPPPEFAGIGITVMDGPFFSTMPFPAKNCHSLTHVRYTPHAAWLPGQEGARPQSGMKPKSNWLHMLKDAVRFVPGLAGSRWKESLFEVKTVLLRNESDDGRPILFSRHPDAPGYVSILGGKLDNIYDIFQVMESFDAPFRRPKESAKLDFLRGSTE